MSDNDTSQALLDRLREGDAQAADELYARYAQRLWGLVEARLDAQLRARIDADDVVQSVMRTFFRRAGDGRFRVDHGTALWKLLVCIAQRKVQRQREKHYAARRDVKAEARSVGTNEDLTPQMVAHSATPEEAIALSTEVESIIQAIGAPGPDVLRLRVEGFSTSEIAMRVGVSASTVLRILQRIEQKLRQRLVEGFE